MERMGSLGEDKGIVPVLSMVTPLRLDFLSSFFSYPHFMSILDVVSMTL